MDMITVSAKTVDDAITKALIELETTSDKLVMTFPVLGLQIGVPNQEPQLKPRLPLKFIAFDNDYLKEIKLSDLSDYDQEVTTYYDLRDANRRIDSFTNQIAGAKLDRHYTKRDEIMKVLHQQGLCTDEGID